MSSGEWDPLDELDEVVGTTLRNLCIARLQAVSAGPVRKDLHAAITRVLEDTEEGLRLTGFSDAAVSEHLAHAFDTVGINQSQPGWFE